MAADPVWLVSVAVPLLAFPDAPRAPLLPISRGMTKGIADDGESGRATLLAFNVNF